MSIGQRLKHARKIRGISQDLLADKIGASRGVITNIELNKVEEPQIMVINAICQVLNISREWLMSGVGSMEVSPEAARSAKILSEIYTAVQELSEEEQLFVLDMLKSYQKRFNK